GADAAAAAGDERPLLAKCRVHPRRLAPRRGAPRARPEGSAALRTPVRKTPLRPHTQEPLAAPPSETAPGAHGQGKGNDPAGDREVPAEEPRRGAARAAPRAPPLSLREDLHLRLVSRRGPDPADPRAAPPLQRPGGRGAGGNGPHDGPGPRRRRL